MPIITIKVSDHDYDDMINHLAADRIGRPLVAVVELIDARNEDGGDIAAPTS